MHGQGRFSDAPRCGLGSSAGARPVAISRHLVAGRCNVFSQWGGGLLQVVEALVELGADPDATTPLGRSTVDWAGYRRASLLD